MVKVGIPMTEILFIMGNGLMTRSMGRVFIIMKRGAIMAVG